MAEFMILEIPAALLLCGAALFLCVFDRARHASRGWFSVLSAALALLGVGVDLLHGADLREAAALLTVFLLLNLDQAAGAAAGKPKHAPHSRSCHSERSEESVPPASGDRPLAAPTEGETEVKL